MDNTQQLQQLMDQQLKEQIASQNTRLNSFETEQKANSTVLIKLDTKFDYMASDIKSLAESMNDKFMKFELRVASLEQLRDQVNPQKIVSQVQEHDAFIQDYKSTHKERNAVIGALLGGIAFLISLGNFFAQFFI